MLGNSGEGQCSGPGQYKKRTARWTAGKPSGSGEFGVQDSGWVCSRGARGRQKCSLVLTVSVSHSPDVLNGRSQKEIPEFCFACDAAVESRAFI